ncbi:MAG: YIP1 family protein [Deltaproteobacteria bacterium]
MLARCPSCRNTFSAERSGTQNCPVCGKPLIVPEAAAPAPMGELVGAAGTPWERRAQLGFWTAWGQTLQQALFEPSRLFGSARLDRGAAQLGFAVLTTWVFSAIGQVFDRLLRARMPSGYSDQLAALLDVSPEMVKKAIAIANSPGWFVAVLLAVPVVTLLFVYANAAVTHFFALVMGQAKRGFAATFAACAYASAPMVLLPVPGCGWIVSVIWAVVLTGIGLKQTHRISPGGAAGVTLAPYLLICCLAMVAIAATAMRMGQMTGTP